MTGLTLGVAQITRVALARSFALCADIVARSDLGPFHEACHGFLVPFSMRVYYTQHLMQILVHYLLC